MLYSFGTSFGFSDEQISTLTTYLTAMNTFVDVNNNEGIITIEFANELDETTLNELIKYIENLDNTIARGSSNMVFSVDVKITNEKNFYTVVKNFPFTEHFRNLTHITIYSYINSNNNDNYDVRIFIPNDNKVLAYGNFSNNSFEYLDLTINRENIPVERVNAELQVRVNSNSFNYLQFENVTICYN